MTIDELRDWTREASDNFPYVVFPEELLSALTEDLTKMLADDFGSRSLMRLPKAEIEYFEWLRREDPEIWEDLWELDEDNGDPYVVSMKFLPVIMQKTRGFPICDLVNHDNYYFTEEHMVDKESKIMLESVQKRFLDRKRNFNCTNAYA